MPQYSAAVAVQAAASAAGPVAASSNNKLNLLQQHIAATDFAATCTTGTNLSHSTPAGPLSQCAIPVPPQNGCIGDNGESVHQGGAGAGAAAGNGGRRGTKRSHEESIQQDRNDVTNGNALFHAVHVYFAIHSYNLAM